MHNVASPSQKWPTPGWSEKVHADAVMHVYIHAGIAMSTELLAK
jgi:hypothetical protein